LQCRSAPAVLLLASAAASQQMLLDFTPGPAPSAKIAAAEPVVFGGRVLFRGTNSTGGQSLWSTDGTPAGTTALDRLVGQPGAMFATGAFVLFEMLGAGIWKTDGTLGGTTMLSAYAPSTSAAPLLRGAVQLPGTVLFGLTNGELWRTDGTAAGT